MWENKIESYQWFKIKFQGLVLKFCCFEVLCRHWFFHLYFGPFPCFVFFVTNFWSFKLLVYLGVFFCVQFLFFHTFGLFRCFYLVSNLCFVHILVPLYCIYVLLCIYHSKLLTILSVIFFLNCNMEEWWVAYAFPRFGDVSL